MKKVSTLNELALFTQIEKDLSIELLKENTRSPRKSSINNILAFSKALSVRQTESGDHIEMVLN